MAGNILVLIIKTDDATHAASGSEKVHFSHNETLLGEQGGLPGGSSGNGLRKQRGVTDSGFPCGLGGGVLTLGQGLLV